MPQTVSNGNVTVVNTGSAHTAYVGSDPCLNGPWDNAAYSANLVPGTRAEKTLIGKNPIATEGTKWSPSESGGKLGVKSCVSKDEAEVTSGSQNLECEGKPAARADDPTTQNKGNSTGSVKPGTIAPSAESQEERAKKLCYLKSWTGVIDGTDGKVKLGWKGGNKTGDPNYIEVWDTAKITFTATREDITQAAATNPKCERGTHTDWHASGKVFPILLETGKLDAKGTDTFTVPARLVVSNWLRGSTLAWPFAPDDDDDGWFDDVYEPRVEGKKDQESQFAGRSAVDAKAEGVQGEKGRAIHRDEEGHNRPVVADKNVPKPKDNPWNKPPQVPGLEVDLKTVLMWFWWFVKTPSIAVSAQACGGARTATILVLPETKVKFKYTLGKQLAGALKKKETDAAKEGIGKAEDAMRANAKADPVGVREAAVNNQKAAMSDKYGEDPSKRRKKKRDYREDRKKLSAALSAYANAEKKLKDLEAALEAAKTVLDTAQKVAHVAGKPIHYEFLKHFSLELEISYERTTEKQGLFYYYTDATMGQKWVFSLNIEKIIGIDWTCYVSLLNLAGPYMETLATVMRRARIFQVDIFFRIELSAGMKISIAKTEVDEFSGGAQVNCDPRVSMGLAMGVGGIDIIRATFVVAGKGKLEFSPPKKKEDQTFVVFWETAFSVGTYYSVILFPDRWWEVKLCQGQILPWQFNTKSERYGLLSMPG